MSSAIGWGKRERGRKVDDKGKKVILILLLL